MSAGKGKQFGRVGEERKAARDLPLYSRSA
jgi:hypothetical protein